MIIKIIELFILGSLTVMSKEILDSTTYRKLLEFIKKEGAETFISFYNDYTKIKPESLIFQALCEGKHPLFALIRNHRTVARFIKELNDLSPCILLEQNLFQLLNSITRDNISQQIETARTLEELKIDSVTIGRLEDSKKRYQTLIKYNGDEVDEICKYYSNGELTYMHLLYKDDDWVEYSTCASFISNTGNFILGVENGTTKNQNRYISVSDFAFDASLLPSEEELARIEPPKSLTDSKVYVKRK